MILGLLGMSRRTCLFIWPERLQQWRDSLFRSQKTLFSSPRAENSLFSALELENRLFSPPRTRKQTYLITKQWIYSFCLEIQILYLCRKKISQEGPHLYSTLEKIARVFDDNFIQLIDYFGRELYISTLGTIVLKYCHRSFIN